MNVIGQHAPTNPASILPATVVGIERRVADVERELAGRPPLVMIETGTYTPSLTSMSVGTTGASNDAEWLWVGGANTGDDGLLEIRGRLVWGTAGTRTFPTSTSRIALPSGFQAASMFAGSSIDIGHVRYTNPTGVGLVRVYPGATGLGLVVLRTGSGNVGLASPSASIPDTWADGASVNYEATLRAVRV